MLLSKIAALEARFEYGIPYNIYRSKFNNSSLTVWWGSCDFDVAADGPNNDGGDCHAAGHDHGELEYSPVAIELAARVIKVNLGQKIWVKISQHEAQCDI